MTILEARMTQIMGGGEEFIPLQGGCGLRWEEGTGGGGIYVVKELGMVFRYHPPLQMNHCSVNAALIS